MNYISNLLSIQMHQFCLLFISFTKIAKKRALIYLIFHYSATLHSATSKSVTFDQYSAKFSFR